MRVTGSMAETLLLMLAFGIIAFFGYEVGQLFANVLVRGEWG